MFKPFERDGKLLGFSFERGRHFYFFGSGHLRREDLTRIFPQYRFCFLKQVHGKTLVKANPSEILEADAQMTEAPGLALVAQSADCLPVLLSSENQICAIHAGWRGMAQNIIQASGHHIARPDFAAIGPHILFESFEVGLDVADQLIRAAPVDAQFTKPTMIENKVLFDLKALALSQIRNSFGAQITVEECCRDTKSDLNFHSYRRGKEKALRQYSFVAMKY